MKTYEKSLARDLFLKISMVPSLTTGAINRILNGDDVANAVLQILGCKKINGGGSTDRYRLLISDGVTGCPYAMLGTQLNHLVTEQQLEKYTIIQVDKCVCNQVQPDRKIIILLSLSVLVPGADVNEKIGCPSNSNATSTAATLPNATASRPESNYNHGVGINSSADHSVHPINTLTPYQNKWTIKGRVTSKTPLRSYSTSRGEGKVFSFNMLDGSGEIRATGFNDQAEKFYDLLEVNKVFYLSKAAIKPANTRYSSVKNEYELTLNNETTIIPCEQESTSSIPMMQFDFITIAQVEQQEKDANVDVIGVCKSCTEAQTFIARSSNKEMTKRDVRLIDRSGREVNLTLWGKEAENFDGSSNPVVAVKGARVSDFNGKSLSVSMSSTMTLNPDIKEAHVLKGWFEREGRNLDAPSISGNGLGRSSNLGGGEWKTFAQTVTEQLGTGEKADYYVNKATVVMVRKENCMYQACPTEDCNKKVVDMNNGVYRCEKCGREYDSFKWRLLLSLSLADFTENQWATCFQEAAEMILGCTAQELGHLKETDEESYNQVLAKANFKSYIFKLRAKMETYNEESRLKSTVATITEIDPITYVRKLITDINQMEKDF